MENHLNRIESPTTNEEKTRSPKINRIAARLILVLSLIALLTVLSGYAHSPQPPETDEGTAAHIFQLSIVALVPAILLFLATADWQKPLRGMRPLAFPATAVMLAFAALFYLELYR